MKPSDLAKEINKALGLSGPTAIKMGGDDQYVVKYISTGSIVFDVILGGGLPRNRIVEFFGGFSTLKSLLGIFAIASVQRDGGTAALVDTEHTFDAVWGASHGVTKDLILPPVETGEDACDVTEVLVRNGIDLIVWDSVAATMPQDEGRKRLGGKENIQPARQAAFMSAMLRRINSINTNTAIMFINQTREKVGITFGSPETTPGGKSLPFYASMRVSLHKGKTDTSEVETFDGVNKGKVKRTNSYVVRAKVEKSKLNSPGSEYLFTWDVVNNRIDDIGFLIGLGLEHGAIKTPTNTSWKMGKTTIAGKDKFRAWLTTNEAAQAEILRTAGFDSLAGNLLAGRYKAAAPRKRLRLKKA